jgi:protein involved in plasmid replication-relaxation
MSFFADSLIALCIRTQQSESSVLDKWYGLFMLSTELDDERLMRLRLERLLCWRESPERWPCYQHMLPVLILANLPRQRDHWQRAVEATSLKLHLEPLAGALACLPQSESTSANPLAHPLLSDEELAAFLNLLQKSVRCSLYDLHSMGCLEPIPTEAGKRWHLCGHGLRLIAAANHMHIRNIAALSDDGAASETSTVVQRGEAWLLQRIGRTAGIYGFFLRPDALAEYRVGQQQMRFWLEWDRGTMNVRDLSIKFTAYEHFVTSREWVREDARVPRLFCIAPDIAQEKRVRRVAHAKLAHTSGLVVCTTTEVLLNEHGPLAPIWLLGTQGYDQGGLTGSVQRYGWSQLISSSKAM